uniref:Ig-like domain-containing protein n=1 Tax=Callorhinchus milii TaxID=7868 RepID=A0A4W3GPI1_CALMI
LTLLLLLLLFDPPGVTQWPPAIQALSGQTVTLNCSFAARGVTVKTWLKDGAALDLSSPRYSGRVAQADAQTFRARGDATIHLSNLSVCDSGRYVCRVQ